MTQERIKSVVNMAIDKGRKPMEETKTDKLVNFFLEDGRFCFTSENKRGERYTDDYSLIDLVSHCGGLLKYLKFKNPNEKSLCENTITNYCFEEGIPTRNVLTFENVEFHQMKLVILNREAMREYLYKNVIM